MVCLALPPGLAAYEVAICELASQLVSTKLVGPASLASSVDVSRVVNLLVASMEARLYLLAAANETSILLAMKRQHLLAAANEVFEVFDVYLSGTGLHHRLAASRKVCEVRQPIFGSGCWLLAAAMAAFWLRVCLATLRRFHVEVRASRAAWSQSWPIERPNADWQLPQIRDDARISKKARSLPPSLFALSLSLSRSLPILLSPSSRCDQKCSCASKLTGTCPS